MILLLNILVIYNQSKSHGQYTLHDNLAVHRIFGWEIYPGILIGNFCKEFTSQAIRKLCLQNIYRRQDKGNNHLFDFCQATGTGTWDLGPGTWE